MNKRPHIILFNPDQWRGNVLGHAGDPAAVTPNLDRLARTDGMSFLSAFCQNTVCTPSRCSFMTGWYPHVRGHRTMHHMLHPERGEPNLLKILRDNGYYVWWGGKNDLVPGQDGTDAYCDVRFKATEADFDRWNMTPQPSVHSDAGGWRGAPGSDTYYGFLRGKLDPGDNDVYGDGDWADVHGAVEFIQSYDRDDPVVLFLSLGYPHPPYGVEDPWYSMIDRDKLPERTSSPEDWAGKPLTLSSIAESQNLTGWPEERWTELRAIYYGMCARVDHQFGLVVDALKEAGMYDDAAIFFFSDHGDYTGDYGLVEKTQNTFEDCLSRVPFLIKAPKTAGGRCGTSDALVELTDLSATVFDLTGIDPGYTSFGKSLVPLLRGEQMDHRDAAFCEGGRLRGEVQAMERDSLQKFDRPSESLYWPRIRIQGSDEGPWHGKAAMCRTRRYKYVMRLYEQDELYDLERDPREITNLIDASAYTDVRSRLQQRLLRWYMETADVVPVQTDQRQA